MKTIAYGLSTVTAMLTLILFLTSTGCNSGPTTTTTAVTASVDDSNTITNSDAIIPDSFDFESSISQKYADIFSWQTFLAVNWPADTTTCGPDTTGGMTILSGKGPVVWETYLTPDQVFVDPGSQPTAWCGGANAGFGKLPPKVQELAKKTGVYRFISRTSKSPHDLDEAVGGPLVDQNGRFVRYEVRMNQDEYNYITANNLWNAKGQQQFVGEKKTIAFPAGPSTYGPVGPMEFKAAWKVLGNGDDPSRFYTIKAIVYNTEDGAPSPGENPVTLGLVGLHIAHKTKTQTNWAWSTFEQVDNLTKSFFNPNCPTCPVNQQLANPNSPELDPNGKPLNPPTQVKRVNPIGDAFADTLNQQYQAMLKGSVWANYQLVSTQWVQFDDLAPAFLANSVQETYIQGPTPASYGNFPIHAGQPYFTSPQYRPFSTSTSSSCMGCHYVASIPSLKVKTDFSFLLSSAK